MLIGQVDFKMKIVLILLLIITSTNVKAQFFIFANRCSMPQNFTIDSNHSNGNVNDKLMYTFPSDKSRFNTGSTLIWRMITGWISHSSSVRIVNPDNSVADSSSITRNNGSFSTVDEYVFNLTNVKPGARVLLTTSARVWNNSNGNHARDEFFGTASFCY
jgi:hypothetical protein